MASDLLNIARNGVQTSQAQLAVTSNNIANANTVGYHRQVATQSSLDSFQAGNISFGSGSYISDVKRIYNDFAARELRIGQTGLSEAETKFSKLSSLDQLYSQSGKAVPSGLNDFYAQLNSLADLPDDLGVRSTVLSSANNLANSVNQMQKSLNGEMSQTNDQIKGITDRINELSSAIGSINRELMESGGDDSQLLDRQDALIQELSLYAEVNVIPLETGAKSVMLGGSVMLVSGEVSMQVGTKQGDPFPQEPQLIATSGDHEIKLSGANLGGQLGALFEYRDETLVSAQQELGQFALGVADAFNQAQANGFDLNGQVGQNIFTDINDPLISAGRVGALSDNTGSANLSVDISNTGELTGSTYQLDFTTSGGYTLTDDKGNETTLTLNAAGDQLTGADGFSINIDTGTVADGDSFEIRPTADAAAGFKVELTDPEGIAAAGSSTTGAGDNTNALEMATLSEAQTMNGGKSSFIDVYEGTKLEIGSQTKGAETRLASATSVFQQAESRVQSESGVNLDEEAANLLRFQQSYQASARIMTTSQQIFDTLLSAVN
ncbi:flagellar hook-associated protein FlgK [Parashewanella spongiae]|uniref:Flagellar hook-associated protein 1 n=1 Tax=Parashewanella spongiae TaxID=342950 RepID=A0A3A6U5S6_9GAMM|nr:flagellar hook-associated protein FlgK [Parashewanella spongiae]MCL1076615.1 flagellar hook-associated protein FlgK [Parashewanella spongiae]RJY19569.1 flagellar hook-associated protein FlgK [Parashewanella spongiae]